ncbi:carboxy terminal-processing peptidase [Psychrobium sp. MM17-31]|uniref:carboxy terminal-processing peptidase n=1 Tax=Psychrobium sp. MM17-31 TaxID=2917758 RepID=UPI001EF5E4BB|nr:carboxy terminal-processing peptidase [Psychrobium sp. MM17-31]MCG7529795.1 carboxy terminal-processing peptidase [Psychrobium sp. MM17-31]
MLNRITLGIIPLMLAGQALAIDSKYKMDEIPKLAPEPQHKVSTTRLTGLFTRTHFKPFDLNDEFSQKIAKRYIDNLDFNKSLFTQADIDSMKGIDKSLDDMLNAGDVSAIYDMYELGMKRRFERYQYALSLLDKPMDFTTEDEYVYDREDANWAKDNKELDELWRQRVKYDALNLKLAGKTWPEIQEVLAKRYNNALKRITQTNSEDVYQVFMNSFSRAIDPHTSYLSPRNAERFQVEMSLSLEGIGAMLRSEDDYTIITELVPGGPADKSEQLAPDDKIIGVGQGEEKIVDVVGWRLDDVVDLIKGPKGSTVKLEVMSGKVGGLNSSRVVAIERDKIKLEDRQAKLEIIESKLPEYKNRRLGVIDIPSFYVNLTRDVKKLIVEAKEKGVEGLVIDLRNNGGGSLPEAMALSGLFIDQGPIVQVKNGENRVDVKYDPDNTTFYDGKVSVLVNRYSASASEIFAAALQDYGRALVLGEQTFGKGTVQQHRGLSRIYDYYKKPIGYITYTIQKFYRINGGSTQNEGVTPDILFPTPIVADEFGEIVADNTLPWDSIPKARYKVVGEVSPSSFKPLSDKHLKRIANEQEFVFMNEDIARYKADKDKMSVSLNEKVRKKERAESEERSLTRANLRRKAQGLEPVKSLDELPKKSPALDPYLDEAANVTFDFIDLGKIAKR